MASVLVISDDILPKDDIPGRAAGIRAWEIGQGLKANGLDVIYAVRTSWWTSDQSLPRTSHNEIYWNSPTELSNILQRNPTHALVNCSYPSLLPPIAQERVIIQDSHGPRLLEGIFRKPNLSTQLAWAEAVNYVSADYFVCASEAQLNYFYPFLALSGFDLTDISRFLVVRLGFSDTPPTRESTTGRLLFGGTLLPWTDPRIGWQVACSECEKAHGRLVIFASAVLGDTASQHLVSALDAMRTSPNCEVHPKVSRSEYLRELSRSSAALDVMAYNPERALAFPTRTAEYLWAGLPPITYDYGEIGKLVREYNAGWSVSPTDEKQIRIAVREALCEPDLVRTKSEGAFNLHAKLLHPKQTTRDLARICREGTKRPGSRVVTNSRLKKHFMAQLNLLIRRLYGVS